MTKIVVIGGGASGLMSAIQAARKGASVTILEHNDKVGKKILATGNGRCNLTNLHQQPSCYRCSDAKYPWKIIAQFSEKDTLHFFHDLGIETKERNGWIYPYSDQASSICEVLEMEARYLKVKIKTKEEVIGINKLEQGYQVLTKGWHYDCDKVIISCGSHASSVEGSSDTGYSLAKSLGHKIITPLPALTALRGKGNYFSKWAGTRMDGIVKLFVESTLTHQERGEILFTEYGISGICVFQISRYAVRAIAEGKKVECSLDLMPDQSFVELQTNLELRKQRCSYKSLPEQLVGLIPKKMISIVVPSKATISQVCTNLKEWKLPIKDAYSLKQAQVCSGGVDVRSLTEQLESKKCPGIYFTGEIIDVDGPCGGYNLQWAWSSGAVAGKDAAKE